MQEYEKYGTNWMQIAKILSTQTPAQNKKHAECFFKQNLKTNSAAVKRYLESLSPDWKAQVLVKHAAEQQKYQQSLSPEVKDQILNKDAAAHRKQRESLPSKKKARLLDENAVAQQNHHESLSPEAKTQMLTNNAAAHKNNASLCLLTQKIKFDRIMLLHTKSNENLSESLHFKQRC
jgi:hypothetical protein